MGTPAQYSMLSTQDGTHLCDLLIPSRTTQYSITDIDFLQLPSESYLQSVACHTQLPQCQDGMIYLLEALLTCTPIAPLLSA